MVGNILKNCSVVVVLVCATGYAAAQTDPTKTVVNAPTRTEMSNGGGILNSIFGCNAPGSKQIIGAAGGGVVGGAIGNRVAGKGNRKIGTVVGATVGAAAGSALGCKLQRDDQRRAEEAATRAAQTDQSQSWKNTQTGASGSAEVIQPEEHLNGLTLAPTVMPASAYTGGGGYYVTTANANIRALPSLDGQIVGRLTHGEIIWSVGAAAETGWLLVVKDNVGKGYVSPSLLERQPETVNSCKVIRHSVTVPGKGTEVQNLNACLNSDGNWVFSPASG